MTIRYYRHWVLRRMGRGLCRSDPHLAAMLAIFTRLTAGEAIDSREQAGPPGSPMRRILARLGGAITVAAACLCSCARRALRRAAITWTIVWSRLRRGARPAASAPTTPGNPADPGRFKPWQGGARDEPQGT